MKTELGSIALDCLQELPWWPDLVKYHTRTPSIGCSFPDYWTLYRTLRRLRPAEVLECGTGTSTVVIAHALRQNATQGYPGHLTTLEESPYYAAIHDRLFPSVLRPFVTALVRDRADGVFSCFRGTRYQDVPDRPYTFVFVDGPNPAALADGALVANLDFLDVVGKSAQPVLGLIDGRLTTVFLLQSVLPAGLARYHAETSMTRVGPCQRTDLAQLDLKALSRLNRHTGEKVVLR